MLIDHESWRIERRQTQLTENMQLECLSQIFKIGCLRKGDYHQRRDRHRQYSDLTLRLIENYSPFADFSLLATSCATSALPSLEAPIYASTEIEFNRESRSSKAFQAQAPTSVDGSFGSKLLQVHQFDAAFEER